MPHDGGLLGGQRQSFEGFAGHVPAFGGGRVAGDLFAEGVQAGDRMGVEMKSNDSMTGRRLFPVEEEGKRHTPGPGSVSQTPYGWSVCLTDPPGYRAAVRRSVRRLT